MTFETRRKGRTFTSGPCAPIDWRIDGTAGDSVLVVGKVTGGDNQEIIVANSGPNGEYPTGFLFAGVIPDNVGFRLEQVTCLKVSGNVAVVGTVVLNGGLPGQADLIYLKDGGPLGAGDTINTATGNPPVTECPDFFETGGGLDFGDIVIHDE